MKTGASGGLGDDDAPGSPRADRAALLERARLFRELASCHGPAAQLGCLVPLPANLVRVEALAARRLPPGQQTLVGHARGAPRATLRTLAGHLEADILAEKERHEGVRAQWTFHSS